MKTIMLLRHAKSSHDPNLKDFNRPLADIGQTNVPNMGKFVKQVDVKPAHVVCSPAKRAQQTTELLLKSAGIDSSLIAVLDDLYFGGARDYLSVIQKAPAGAGNIMLVGHNPLLKETISLLCDGEGAFTVRLPTTGLVCIEHPAIEWKQVKPGTARLQWIMTPGLLHKLID